MEVDEFEEAASKKHVTIQEGKTAPAESVRDTPEKDYDTPF